MAEQGDSGIDYVTKSWGCWRGCHHVSAGCDHCYGKRDMKRFGHDPHKVVRAADSTFFAPLEWRKPQTVFVCPWSDFFIEEADQWRRSAWKVIVNTNHKYLFVTKRPERISFPSLPELYDLDVEQTEIEDAIRRCWFIPTCENQEMLEKRLPIVLDLKARGIIQNVGVSVEPMLEPIDLSNYLTAYPGIHLPEDDPAYYRFVDRVIIGCESGPKKRPCKNKWIQGVVDQCVEAGVRVWVKQIHLNGKLVRDIKLFPPGLRRRK